MRSQFGKIAVACMLAVAGIPSVAYSQVPAPAAPNGSVVVASPTYTSIAMEITVNRPAADVWKRIGKYCDVSEWLQIPAGCKITSGTDGEFGAVRTVGAEVTPHRSWAQRRASRENRCTGRYQDRTGPENRGAVTASRSRH